MSKEKFNWDPSLYSAAPEGQDGSQPPVRQPGPAPKPLLPAGKTERIFAVILLVLSLFAANVCIYGGQLGFTISYILGGGAVLGYLALSHRLHVKSYGFICLIGATALAGAFLRTADWGILFPSFFLVLFAFALCLLSWTGVGKRSLDGFSCLWDACSLAFVRTFGQIGPAFRGLARWERKKPRSLAALWGVLLALPVLLILVPLLMSADAAFEGLADRITLPHLDWWTILVGLFVFLLAYPLSVSLARSRPQEELSPEKQGSVSPASVNSFLIVISLLYGVYLFSQIAYFWNGFLGILPEGYSKAEYARRGFFEMVPLVIINLVILTCALRLVRREGNAAPKSTRGLCLFLIVFSLFLLSTAASKMIFYIGSYGLTYDRLTASLFMIWMAVCLIAVGLRLFLPKTPYMKIAVISVLLLANLACWGDVDTLIARYNVQAYQSGILSEIDVYYLEDLGDSAVPYLAELLEDSDPEVAEAAEKALIRQMQWSPYIRIPGNDLDDAASVTIYSLDWRSWTISAANARSVYADYLENRGITILYK